MSQVGKVVVRREFDGQKLLNWVLRTRLAFNCGRACFGSGAAREVEICSGHESRLKVGPVFSAPALKTKGFAPSGNGREEQGKAKGRKSFFARQAGPWTNPN